MAQQALIDSTRVQGREPERFQAIAIAAQASLTEQLDSTSGQLTSSDGAGLLGAFDVEQVGDGWAVTRMMVRLPGHFCIATE